MRTGSRRWVWMGVVGVIAVAGLFVRHVLGTEIHDPFAIADRFRHELISGDCRSAISLMSRRELQANGMSDEDFCRFVTDWLRPRIQRVSLGPPATTFGDGDAGFQTYSWGVSTLEGNVPLAFSVAKTDEGLRVVQPLTSIFMSFATADRSGVRATLARDKLSRWSKNARRLAPELAVYRFTKVQVRPEWSPMTLEDFARWCDRRLATLPPEDGHRVRNRPF